jgi:alcohol dehydrogenase class IV
VTRSEPPAGRPQAAAGFASFAVTTKVISGLGSLRCLPAEIARLGGKRIAVVADRGVAGAGVLNPVTGRLPAGTTATEILVDADPDIRTAELAAASAREAGCDLVLAVGGGSALGAAKAVAIGLANEAPIGTYEGTDRVTRRPAPTVAIPTTAGSGSEVSKVLVLHEPGRDTEVIIRVDGGEPCVAILDATMLRGLPRAPMLFAGLDALSHSTEAQWARGRTWLTAALGHSAAATIMDTLPIAVDGAVTGANKRGANDAVLQRLLEASCAANMACGNSGLTLVHALSGAPAVRVPHGQQNGILLPYVARFNEAVCDPAVRAQAGRLNDLYDALDFTPGYDAAALPERAAEAMVRAASSHPFRPNNPRASSDADLYALLASAGVPRKPSPLPPREAPDALRPPVRMIWERRTRIIRAHSGPTIAWTQCYGRSIVTLPPATRDTHRQSWSPAFFCRSLRKTSRWSSSPSQPSTGTAHRPHSPRRQSYMTSAPAASSASTAVWSAATVATIPRRGTRTMKARVVSVPPLPKVSKRSECAARPAASQVCWVSCSRLSGPHT